MYAFGGYVFCPIARKRCPNTEDTQEYCIFGDSESVDSCGNPMLTGCTVYDLATALAGSLHDCGIPVEVSG